jgi:hypothetical protein
MFRNIRIAILLTILAIVAGNQWLTKNRFSSWDGSLWVTVYPVLAESDATIQQYAESLNPSDFADIGSFIKREAARYGRNIERPVVIQVAQPLTSQPPDLPTESSGLKVAIWSLKMRWWAWRNGREKGLAPDDIKMFVRYQNHKPNVLLERSVGIQNGGYGVVNAVASRQMAARNRIVITHELMHILGASDKYDARTGQPFAPEGLANPAKNPLYPQNQAEIMAGRIAVSASNWSQPARLSSNVVGELTASEIGWLPETK